MKPLSAHFLIASPQLLDPNFVKSVVLMIQHNDEGALGVIVNRPGEKTVKELWTEVGDAPCENVGPVCLGGPVPGPLLAVHTNQFFAEMEILPGVFLAATKGHLDELMLQEGDPVKVFLGHAGWGPGQLESELEAGAWFTTPASIEHIFYDGTDLWEKVTKTIGAATLQSMLHLKHMPDDPSVN